jgi:hypothetical protein
MTSFAKWVSMLQEFKAIPNAGKPRYRPPTFLEITQFPHYENVSTNILRFFLDPSEPHGLGTSLL